MTSSSATMATATSRFSRSVTTGSVLRSVISSSGLPNPSALALASFSNSGLEFYATNDGEASASLVGFQLEESSAVSTASTSGASASLVSLNESSLALLGTMLTITLETTSNENEGGVEAGAAVGASGSGGAGQSLNSRLSSQDEFGEMSEMPPLTSPGVPVQASWSRFVTGVDQAIERVRSEADARLQEEQQQPKAQAPGTSFLEEDGGGGRRTPAAFVKEAAIEAGRIIKVKRTLIEAIDFAIGTWGRGSLRAVRIAALDRQRSQSRNAEHSTAGSRRSRRSHHGRPASRRRACAKRRDPAFRARRRRRSLRSSRQRARDPGETIVPDFRTRRPDPMAMPDSRARRSRESAV